MNRRDGIDTALRALVPGIPRHELAAVTDHALASPGLKKASPDKAAWLSLVAYLRHRCSDYEALLDEGYGVEAARHFSRQQINDQLTAWGSRRLVAGDEDPG